MWYRVCILKVKRHKFCNSILILLIHAVRVPQRMQFSRVRSDIACADDTFARWAALSNRRSASTSGVCQTGFYAITWKNRVKNTELNIKTNIGLLRTMKTTPMTGPDDPYLVWGLISESFSHSYCTEQYIKDWCLSNGFLRNNTKNTELNIKTNGGLLRGIEHLFPRNDGNHPIDQSWCMKSPTSARHIRTHSVVQQFVNVNMTIDKNGFLCIIFDEVTAILSAL